MSGNGSILDEVAAIVDKNSREGRAGKSVTLQTLDHHQRHVLALFEKSNTIIAKDIEILLRLNSRIARELCPRWVQEGFIVPVTMAKKTGR